jgi:ribosome biogenesis protein BMS1
MYSNFCFDSMFSFHFATLDGVGENASKWKESLLARTLASRSANLMQLVYGQQSSKLEGLVSKDNGNETDSSDEEFFVPKGLKKVKLCCI